MPFRKRVIRRTRGKTAIKKSATLINNIGPSSTITAFILVQNTISRSLDGATVTVRDSQNTGVTANIGDLVKYINIRIQAGARDAIEPEDDTSGWLEWGVVKQKETFISPQLTNLGIQTLGDTLTKQFRGDQIMNGAIPVGGDIPNVIDIQIKVPDNFIKMQLGSSITLFCHYRSVNSASTAVDLINLTLSTQYKLYV